MDVGLLRRDSNGLLGIASGVVVVCGRKLFRNLFGCWFVASVVCLMIGLSGKTDLRLGRVLLKRDAGSIGLMIGSDFGRDSGLIVCSGLVSGSGFGSDSGWISSGERCFLMEVSFGDSLMGKRGVVPEG